MSLSSFSPGCLKYLPLVLDTLFQTRFRHAWRVKVACACLFSLSLFTLSSSEIVYNNLRNDLKKFYFSEDEIGDEVILESADGPIESVDIESITFELIGRRLSGDETVQFRIYQNDGDTVIAGGRSPGTLRFESEPFGLPETSGDTLEFSVEVPVGITQIPPHFTWTLTFSGVDPLEQLGVSLYSPPIKGNNYDDFWVHVDGSAWSLQRIRSLPSDFGAVILASDVRIKPKDQLRLEMGRASSGFPELTLRSPSRNKLFLIEASTELSGWQPVAFFNNAVSPLKYIANVEGQDVLVRQYFRASEHENVGLRYIEFEGGGHHLEILGAPGLTYQIQGSSDLSAWRNLVETSPDQTPHRVILPSTLFDPDGQPRFFRLNAFIKENL